jgi:4-amino-4-deoxy-L-arabinose transferase-like glycosyltransferase
MRLTLTTSSFDRWDVLLGLTTFAGSLALYIHTLTPGLLSGDSGEFQTLAYLLGHTHPTGYPIYLILAKLVTFLPVGEVAYCVNLFSALMGALTVTGIYFSGRLLAGYRIFAFLGAIVLTISPTFWSQAIIAEVYTAGAAFLIFILLLLIWWEQKKDPKALFFAGLLGGLSLGVHMSVILLFPAALIFLLLHSRQRNKLCASAFKGAATGLLLTVLVFWLIDLNNPTANYFSSVIEPSRSSWDLSQEEIDDPLERLVFGWSARQFRSFMFQDVVNVMPNQAAAYWQNLPQELSWLLFGLAVVGSADLLLRNPRISALILVSLFTQLVCLFNYAIWDIYVFYIPSYILLILLFIVGADSMVDFGIKILRRSTSLTTIRGVGKILVGVMTLLIFMFSIWPIFQPQQKAVLIGEIPFESDKYPTYNENLLKISYAMVIALPENAIVFTNWDMVWPYYYIAHIKEKRKDLIFIETYPADDIAGVADSVVDYVKINLEHHPIFFSEREPALLEAGLRFAPSRYGPVRLVRVLDTNSPP